jgi:capsular polysaccharide transport system ATP-binding protein
MDVSAHFGPGERVGILAASGAGKSTIARLLTGVEQPDSGTVLRAGRVSWPMGFAGGFHPDLTLMDNLTLLADLLREPRARLIGFCAEFADLHDVLNQPVKMLSPGSRLAAAFSFSMAVACDTYIADDTIGFGDGQVRKMSEAMLEKRLQNAGLIFLSRNPSQLAKFCERYLVLIDGQLRPCASPEIGMRALQLLDERNGVRTTGVGASVESFGDDAAVLADLERASI